MLAWPRSDNGFLDTTPIACTMKEKKKDKIDFIKIINFYTSDTAVKRMKGKSH